MCGLKVMRNSASWYSWIGTEIDVIQVQQITDEMMVLLRGNVMIMVHLCDDCAKWNQI